MQNSQNTILSDYQEKLAETFEHINYLIDNDKIDNAKTALLELHFADLADFLDNTNHKLYDLIFTDNCRRYRTRNSCLVER